MLTVGCGPRRLSSDFDLGDQGSKATSLWTQKMPCRPRHAPAILVDCVGSDGKSDSLEPSLEPCVSDLMANPTHWKLEPSLEPCVSDLMANPTHWNHS